MQNDIQATASNNDEVIKKTEQVEEVDEQVEEETDEQTGDEEQAEQTELQAKIDEVDAKIEQYRINAVEARKVQAMKKFNYDEGQIEKYISFIDGETVEEIERSVLQLTDNIAPNKYYGDPSLNNGAAAKPKPVDKKEVGRNAVKRILNKIRL